MQVAYFVLIYQFFTKCSILRCARFEFRAMFDSYKHMIMKWQIGVSEYDIRLNKVTFYRKVIINMLKV